MKEIPKGDYCYSVVGYTSNKLSISACPYWSMDISRPSQENGYCSYLRMGDWEFDSLSLLWDQVKECEVNLDD